MKISKREVYILFVVIVTIVIDQVSKILVRLYVEANDQIQLIGENFVLMNVENTGAFLGMGSDLNPVLRILLLLLLPIVVLGLVLRYVIQDKSLDKLSVFAFSSIIGGGIANVFDRVVYGSVTDFFYIKLTSLLRTGIFNMADLSVTTGMLILLFVSFNNKKKLL